jgi:hypothetical protein
MGRGFIYQAHPTLSRKFSSYVESKESTSPHLEHTIFPRLKIFENLRGYKHVSLQKAKVFQELSSSS